MLLKMDVHYIHIHIIKSISMDTVSLEIEL
jgi:hypothetical protein